MTRTPYPLDPIAVALIAVDVAGGQYLIGSKDLRAATVRLDRSPRLSLCLEGWSPIVLLCRATTTRPRLASGIYLPDFAYVTVPTLAPSPLTLNEKAQ